jgi:hypothetical protein
VSTEEKPFLEIEELKRLPNNVAVVMPSNGDRTLPATNTYLRPLWVFKKRKDIAIDTVAGLAGRAARHLRFGHGPADHNLETLGGGRRRGHC